MEFEEAYYYFGVVNGYENHDTREADWDFFGGWEKFYEPVVRGLPKQLGKTEAGVRFGRFDAIGILFTYSSKRFKTDEFLKWARTFTKGRHVLAGLRFMDVT